MKILIVGGAGYIGSHVCHAFNDRGDTVSILDNFSSGSRVNYPDNTEVFTGDILDKSFLKKTTNEEKKFRKKQKEKETMEDKKRKLWEGRMRKHIGNLFT